MLPNFCKFLYLKLCLGCLLTLTLCFGLNSTPALAQSSAADLQQFADLPRFEGTAQVEMVVNGYTIEMELRGDAAPVTTGNFVDLVNKGFYNGISFHRVVRDPQPFVVQGGDPQSKDPSFPAGRLGTGGYVDPDIGRERNIPLEILAEGADAPTYNRTLRRGIPVLTHHRGAVAMARAQAPNSASSQFYIALSDLPFLDGNYAVFGYVTDGMDVVDQIQQGDRIESIKIVTSEPQS